MKKITLAVISITLPILLLTGCTSDANNEMTEAEIGAAIDTYTCELGSKTGSIDESDITKAEELKQLIVDNKKNLQNTNEVITSADNVITSLKNFEGKELPEPIKVQLVKSC
jgi:hypothetical protein